MAAGEDKPGLSNQVWEAIKAEEREGKGEAAESVLSDVTPALPGLTRAVKLQRKASIVGFDWNDVKPVLAKIREEIDEIGAAVDVGQRDQVAEEVGDLLFAVANLARHAEVDPEAAVRASNAKFERRFAFIEKALAAKGSFPAASTLAEMDALWSQAKAEGL